MNKRELVDAVAGKVGAESRRAVEQVVDALVATVTETLAKGESIALTGFGTFERRERGARTARNPQTGATVKVKAKKVPAFKPGAGLKEAVASGKAGVKKAAPAKKAAAKKAPAKKAAAKAAPAKKAPAKKAPAKKAPAKKAAKR